MRKWYGIGFTIQLGIYHSSKEKRRRAFEEFLAESRTERDIERLRVDSGGEFTR